MNTRTTENHRRFPGTALALSLMSVMLLVGCHMQGPQRGDQILYPQSVSEKLINRVGVVKRTDLLIAYYGSAYHREYLDKLRNEQQRAREAGDEKRVAEIEKTGKAAQELAHRQLAGKAPLTNITTRISDILAEVARENNLDIIVEKTDAEKYRDAEIIDVTEAVIGRIPAAR